MTIKEEIVKMNEVITKAEQLLNEKQGVKKTLEKQLEAYDCKTLVDVDSKLEALDKELTEKEDELDGLMESLRDGVTQLKEKMSLED